MKILMEKLPALLLAAAVIIGAALTSACEKNFPDSEGKLTVTATTTMLADLAREIGGSYVSVKGLMGSGIDPHQYKASAGDVDKMRRASVIVYNGLNLEGKMGEVIGSLKKSGKTVICVSDGIDKEQLIDAGSGAFDPHIWYDVSLWRQAAQYMTDCFAEADPENAAGYRANFEAYAKRLERLDQYVKSRINQIPEEQRVLITAHDAFRYFGRAYGLEVMGLQGISTATEAGTADMSRLAQIIAEKKVPAVCAASSISPKSIEALQAAVNARGFSVRTGGTLYSDSLGDIQSGTETYIKTFKANADAIAEGLCRG